MQIFQNVTDHGWIKTSETLPKPGKEVLTFHCDSDFGLELKEILTYFKKGDIMLTLMSETGNSPQEILLNTINGQGVDILAEEDGFYIFDSVDGVRDCSYRKHGGNITHWQLLPDRPAKIQE